MRHNKDTLPSATASTNLLALDEEGLGRLVHQFGWPRYRVGQILRWLYQRRATDINQMTDLGQSERTALASHVTIQRAAGCTVFRSSDHTRKLVLVLCLSVSVGLSCSPATRSPIPPLRQTRVATMVVRGRKIAFRLQHCRRSGSARHSIRNKCCCSSSTACNV